MQQSPTLSRFIKTGLSSTALSLALMAGAAQAQQKPAEDKAAAGVQLGTITVKAADPQDITSRPAPVSTISKTEIKLNGREKLDTVLRSTPGVFTSTNASNPGVGVNIRGFEGSGRVNMMIDGAPQTFRTTAHDAQGYSYIDPNLLSSVDITRGAVTTEGGSGLAGSVNFKTIGVEDVLLDGKDKGVLGRVSWGSNGVGFSEMLAGAARMNQVGIVAAISRRDSKDYKNGDGLTQERTGQELTSGLFKTEFKNDEHKLILGGVIYNNKYGTWQKPYSPASPPTVYDFFVQNRTFTAQYNYKPIDNPLVDLNVNTWYNATKLSYTGGNGSFVGREIKNESIGISASNTSEFAFNDIDMSLKYGFEYNHDNTTGTKTGVNPADNTFNRSAVFTELGINYDKLQVLAGLRYDYYKLAGDVIIDNKLQALDNSKGKLNPKVTVAYNVTDWLQPYVTYAHSMRSPTLQETVLGGNPAGHDASMLPNPALRPEQQRGWELGFNVRKDNMLTPEDSFRLKANYFTMQVEDYIASKIVFLTPRTYNGQYINIDGTSRVSGFELESTYDAGMAFGTLAYSHNKSNLAPQNEGLGANQYLPENVVTLTTGARFFERKLETGVRYQHVSSGSTLDPQNPKSDPYNLVDLFATYKFNENVDLSFKVTNVFDKTYTPALSTYGSGQGRTFVVATQFQF